MGCTSVQNKIDNDCIWIDSNINNEENSKYSKDLLRKYSNIKLFTKVENALNFFKNIKFRIAFIIVSGSLFPKFIAKLKDMIYEISSVPKIIIFTSESTKPKIEEMPLINDSFYNKGGLALSFKEVKSFLNNNLISKKLNFIRPLRREITETGAEFTFELLDINSDVLKHLSKLLKEKNEVLNRNFCVNQYLSNPFLFNEPIWKQYQQYQQYLQYQQYQLYQLNQQYQEYYEYILNYLAGIIYLPRLFNEPEEKQCKRFDEYLINNYGDIMKELILQIYNTNCPISLRIKYWLRAYTLETKFYKDMNSDLMKDKTQLYIPYIQLLYSGLKLNNFNFSYTNDLFRGALIKIEEIEKLLKYTKNKDE